jgi:hypothetical protein
MLVRFMEADKPMWQRILAIEVVHHVFLEPGLVVSLCHYYDQQPHQTKIFHDLVRPLVLSFFSSGFVV